MSASLNTVKIRERLFIEQRGLCYICGGRMMKDPDPAGRSRLHASIDHVIPHARGGTNHRDNLKLCHRYCNSWKGARLLEELPVLGLTAEAETPT